MDLAEELIIIEVDPKIKEDSTSQILNNNNQTTIHKPDILKRTFNSSHADGLTPVGSTSNAILPKLNSSAAQTELTLLDSRMVKARRDST
jgi:hypothetical protein